jgi:membrane fusion protein, macrolide-specific efflux system
VRYLFLKPKFLIKTIVIMLFVGSISAALYWFFIIRNNNVLHPSPFHIIETSTVKYNTTKVIRESISYIAQDKEAQFTASDPTNLYFTNNSGRLKRLYVVVGDKVKKGQVLAELDTDSLKIQIQLQELNIQKLNLSYEKMKAAKSDSYSIKEMELDINSAKLSLESMKRELQGSRLTSPIDGVVTDAIKAPQIGQSINPYTKMVQVADPKKVQLTCVPGEYNSKIMTLLRFGTKVDVRLEANPEKVYKGKVVMNDSRLQDKAEDGTKQTAIFQVEGLPDTVEIGDNAAVTLTVTKRTNVLVLPINAIHINEKRNFVYVLRNGIRKERNVGLGISDGEKIEITSGLNEGEEVVMN